MLMLRLNLSPIDKLQHCCPQGWWSRAMLLHEERDIRGNPVSVPYKTLCKELLASNCVYKSRGAIARGMGQTPA